MLEGMAGERALSRQGHAAMSMSGAEDKWREMQQDTFTNWVNEHLKTTGMSVKDITQDLCDGTKLMALVESLQGKSLGGSKRKPTNQHQCLENASLVLKALMDDKIKLVNIGSEDIVEGNDKLIMGLIWLMILRYQIGKTKVPPRKLMLGWIKSIMPECNINNFTTDWNDGVALHALCNFCDPRLSPDWKNLDKSKRLDNCRTAMNTARAELQVPMVLAPEYMASPHLDELSTMTYVSYFMKPNSAGYQATLQWVRKTIPDRNIENFTTDWRDGVNLCHLVDTMGGNVPGHPNHDPKARVQNLQKGIDAGKKLGVQPVLSAKEISDVESEHLGLMAYLSKFRYLTPVVGKKDQLLLVGNPETIKCGQSKVFKLESKSGDVSKPNVKVKMETPSGSKPCRVQWSGKYADIHYTSAEAGSHELHVTYYDDEVSGSPLQYKVVSDLSKLSIPTLQPCLVGGVQEIKIPSNGAGGSDIKVEARTPTGRVIDLPVRQENGQYVVRFTPAETGDWQLSMYCDGKPVQGSPSILPVYDPQQVNIRVAENSEAVLGNPVTFKADCGGAGSGQLRAQGHYNGQPFQVTATPDHRGSYHLSFLPMGKGKHSVRVHFNDTEVKGSPYLFNVTDPEAISAYGAGLTSSSIGRPAEFTLHAEGLNKDDVRIVVKDPHGRLVPSQLKRLGDDYRISYQPTAVGRYNVEVYVSGHLLNSTPYYAEVFDAQKCKIANNKPGTVNEPTNVDVDVRGAGSAEFDVIIKSPNGQALDHNKHVTGDQYHVSYTPRQPGPHTIHLSYGGQPLKGSPVTHHIGAGADRVEILGDGIHRAEEKIEASFSVNTHQAAGELDVKIEDSPYTAQVVNPNKVIPIDGWASLLDNDGTMPMRVNEEKTLKFDTHTAGPGTLTSRVIGPRGEDVPSQILHNDTVRFTPKQQGDHTIHVKWNDYELSDCPVHAMAAPDTLPVEASKVRITGVGANDATVKEQAEFLIDGSRAGPGQPLCLAHILGKPQIHLSGVKTDVDVRVIPIGNDSYKCSYVPLMPGAYLLNVLWGEKPVPGSPFKVTVSLSSDSAKVLCSGEGLRSGVIGKDIKALLDTRKAGPGELSAQCMGPHKPAYCELYDHRDGTYNLNIKPQEPGRHILHVKFAEEHVPGSPFVVKVSGAPDASKVNVNGPGTEPGVLSTYQSRFICETRGAGAGQLTVRIRGPKGAFRVEMQRESQKDRTILCRYDPTEVGEYIIHVKWSGDHVPNSPFHVRIFNTEHELEKFLAENPGTNSKSWNAEI